jgi:hypothetical protein
LTGDSGDPNNPFIVLNVAANFSEFEAMLERFKSVDISAYEGETSFLEFIFFESDAFDHQEGRNTLDSYDSFRKFVIGEANYPPVQFVLSEVDQLPESEMALIVSKLPLGYHQPLILSPLQSCPVEQ